MDPIPTSIVKSFRDSRSLVGINRDKIDVNTIHGFIVDFNDEWLLVQHVYDFFVDGWVLLRRSDISALQSKTTDVFQKALMEEEGSLQAVDFDQRIPPGGILELILTFDSHKVIILEEETEEDDLFNIGFVRGIEDAFIKLNTFSGAGTFDEEESLVGLEDITSISYDTNYTLYYERYFSRRQLKEAF